MLERLPRYRLARGFTLIELLTVVTVLAILVSLAVPSLRSFVVGQRVKTASFDLYASLVFARSEAIKRPAGNLLITPVNTANWAEGWSVTYHTSGTPEVLRQQQAISDITITSCSSASVQFTRDGRLKEGCGTGKNEPFTFSLVATSASHVTGRCVSASLSGNTATKIQPAGGC